MTRARLRQHATLLVQAMLLVTAVAGTGPQPARGQSAASGTPAKARREAQQQYLSGAHALEHNDLRAARTAFARAATLDPQDHDYAAAEQVARANLVTQLIQQADKAQILNRPEEARARLLEAATLAPDNPSVLQHLDPHTNPGVASGEIEDESNVSLSSTVTLLPNDSRHSFHMHGTGQELLRQVLTAYGVTPAIDSSVDGKRTSFDGDDLNYDQAAQLLKLATNSFFVSLDPKRVLVAKDTKDNRDRFVRQVLETVYLPGLSATELTDMGNLARTLFDAQQSSVQPGTNTLTVRAPQAKLAALNRTMADLLDGHSQVDLEVRLIEVDTSRNRNIGAQLPQQFNAFNVTSELQGVLSSNASLVQQIVSSGLAPAGDLAAIVAVLVASGQVTDPLLSGGFATFGNGLTLTGITVPSTTANLSLSSSDTRMLEDIHLRLQDQSEGDLKVGEKYPIQTSSYSGLTSNNISIPGISSAGLSSELAALGLGGAGGVQTPIPQVQYQDIGLELKVTPHVLRSNDVGLVFDLKLQALSGSVVNEIPALTNRQFTANTTTRAGQSAIYVSDLTRQESRAVSGVPGLSQLPGFQSATDEVGTSQKSTLLIIITPQIVRHEHMQLAGPAVVLPRHE